MLRTVASAFPCMRRLNSGLRVGRQALTIARFVSTMDHMAGFVSSPNNICQLAILMPRDMDRQTALVFQRDLTCIYSTNDTSNANTVRYQYEGRKFECSAFSQASKHEYSYELHLPFPCRIQLPEHRQREP